MKILNSAYIIITNDGEIGVYTTDDSYNEAILELESGTYKTILVEMDQPIKECINERLR